MSAKTTILHVTAHLGGGVGRALSSLAAYHGAHKTSEIHRFICLETPQDPRFADMLSQSGAELMIAPDDLTTRCEIEKADIVQIEWWAHPLMFQWLARYGAMPARWIVWAHISGLHYPSIAKSFVQNVSAFVATTSATCDLFQDVNTRVCMIPSVGDLDAMRAVDPHRARNGRCGYLGAMNEVKLHPSIFSFLDAVALPDFKVDFYGDSHVNPALEQEVHRRGASSPIQLRGFTQESRDVLSTLDLFIYLLNPTHYGTTENALLEGMACGLVPIVLDNPVEKSIIEDGVTGFVVRDPASFGAVVRTLLSDEALRQKVGCAAAHCVQEKFSVGQTARSFSALFEDVMGTSKKSLDAETCFGQDAQEWFFSCLGQYRDCLNDLSTYADRQKRLALPFLYEQTKSSVFQFLSYFPQNPGLIKWATLLEQDRSLSDRE